MAIQAHNPAELANLLIAVIVGTAGGNESRWNEALGPVTKLSIMTNVRSNWRVSPTGSRSEISIIRRAVEIVRAAHPYIAGYPASDQRFRR